MPWIYEKPNEYVVFCFVFYIKKSLSKIVLILGWPYFQSDESGRSLKVELLYLNRWNSGRTWLLEMCLTVTFE